MNNVIIAKSVATVAVWTAATVMHKHQTDAVKEYTRVYPKGGPEPILENSLCSFPKCAKNLRFC